MSLKQIVEDNFSILLRAVDPSCDLLGRLTSVPFIKDRISTIDPRLTDDKKNFALLNALREVPVDMAESVMAGFISALRSSGQDHVANMFHRESEKVIMSEEHYELLRMKRPTLCEFLNPGNCFYSPAFSKIFSSEDKRRISNKLGLGEMADEALEILMRKSDDTFQEFITLLPETGQTHVAYILNGEGNSRPLKEEHRRRLLSGQREVLVQQMESIYSGLITSLMSKGVFSSYDEQRVTGVRPNTPEDRNEMILNLIARKSQSDFFNFISALNDTHQTHVVILLIGTEIVAKVKTVYESGTYAGHMRGVDAELLEYMREMFQRNGVVVSKINEILSYEPYKGIAVLSVREGCVEITFGCKSIESLHQLRNLYDSGKLQNMLNEAFCSQFAEKGLESLEVVITNDQFEECVQKFPRWIPMTSEHREALLSSEKLLINKIAINDDLLRSLSLGKRRRQAIESAATREEQVKTLIDIVSRQPDSAYMQLVDYLSDTQQTEAVDIIRGVGTSEDDELRSTFAADANRKAGSAAVDRFKIDATDAWNEVDDNVECLVKSITEREQPVSPGVCSALRGIVKSIRNLRERYLVPSSRPSIEKAIDAELEQLQPLLRSPQSTSSHQG